jgi:WD40 repeat protein
MLALRNRLPAACLALAGVVLVPRAAPAGEPQAQSTAAPARTDRHGDPLPPGARARLGTTRLRHVNVAALTLSPDGAVLASGDGGSTVTLWDTATGKELGRLPGLLNDHTPATFSADGKSLFVLDAAGRLRQWDVASGKDLCVKPPPLAGYVFAAFAPGGKVLAALRPDQSLILWEKAAGGEPRTLSGPARPAAAPPPADPLYARTLAFSADGKLLAEGRSNGNATRSAVRIWDVATGKEGRPLKGIAGGLTSVTFSPDGKLLAVGILRGPVYLFDLATARQVRQVAAAGPGAASLAFSPDGKSLAVGNGAMIDQVELATGKVLRRLPGSPQSQPRLAFSANGKVLAVAGSDAVIRLWDPATGAERAPTAGPRGTVTAVVPSPDGKTVATTGGDHTIRLWDAATGKELRRFVRPGITQPGGPESPWPVALAFARGGRALAVAWRDGEVRVWEAATGKELARARGVGPGSPATAFSPDGRALAAAGPDGAFRLWDAGTGRELRRFGQQRAAPQPGMPALGQLGTPAMMLTAVAFAPDGRTVASGYGGSYAVNFTGAPPAVRLWETASGRQQGQVAFTPGPVMMYGHQFSGGFGGGSGFTGMVQGLPVNSLRFCPDGRTLAIAEGHTMRLWDTAREQPMWQASSRSPWTSTAFSPDGKLLALGGDGTCTLRDVRTGEEVGRAAGHLGFVTALAFSPDGKALLSGAVDTTALVWDVPALLEEGRRRRAEPGRARLEALWADLRGDDAARAHRAVWALAAAPGRAVPLLRARLRPVAPVDGPRLAKLVADLGHPRFALRQQAERELERLGAVAAPALERALEAGPPLEVQRRTEGLLRKVTAPVTGEALRALRAVEVLERAGTAEARQVLEALAAGAPDAALTRDARAALERLGRRPAGTP